MIIATLTESCSPAWHPHSKSVDNAVMNGSPKRNNIDNAIVNIQSGRPRDEVAPLIFAKISAATGGKISNNAIFSHFGNLTD